VNLLLDFLIVPRRSSVANGNPVQRNIVDLAGAFGAPPVRGAFPGNRGWTRNTAWGALRVFWKSRLFQAALGGRGSEEERHKTITRAAMMTP